MSKIPFFARRFVAGTTSEEAISSVKPLNEKGVRLSLDILGEDVTDENQARKFLDDYCKLADQIQSQNLKSGISIKLTMIGLSISDSLCETLLHELLEYTKDHGLFIRIDMEGTNITQQTIDQFLKARKKYSHVGIVLQAYLHRTLDDAKKVVEAGGHIRLCKGAYKEPPSLAFQDMNDIRRNYLEITDYLLQHCEYPAFATHDDILIDGVKERIKTNGRDTNTFEFQMLYGLRQPTWHQLTHEGYRMRVYVPYGTSWMPYFSRRLRERKENVFFILKNMFKA